MFILDVLLELAADATRSLLIDGLSERVIGSVRRYCFGRRLRGMHEVRRHVHRQCRRRLLQRLSTELTE